MNKFDNIIKSRLESAEYPYDASAWSALEAKLEPAAPATASAGSKGFYSGLIGGAIAAAVITTVMVIAPNPSDKVAETPSPQPDGITNPIVAPQEDTKDALTNDGTIKPQEVHEIKLVEVGTSVTQQPDKYDDGGNDEDDNGSDPEIGHNNDTPEIGDGHADVPGLINDFNEFSIAALGIQCPESKITFTVDGLDDEYSVSWLFDGFIPAQGSIVQHGFDSPGQHEAIVIVRKGENSASVERTIAIEIFAKPEAEITYQMTPSETCFSQTVNASALPSENVYEWSVGVAPPRQSEKFELIATKGFYDIKTVITNPEGCVSRITKEVRVAPSFTIWSPTAFTPDGNGANDTWFPVGLDRKGMNFTLQIYKASGTLVYTTNELKPWDGKIRGTNERALAGEMYSWKLSMKDECGNEVRENGTISVVR